MDLLVTIIVIYAGALIAMLAFFFAAWALRKDRPKRARIVIWCFLGLILGVVALMFMPASVTLDAATLEMVALVIGGLLAAGVILGSISLLVPIPQATGAVYGIVIGAILLCVSATALSLLSQVNFSL